MSSFALTLTLTTEPDGEFTLHTVTFCPDMSYVAGKVERKAPEGHSPMKSAVPITVHIERADCDYSVQ